MPPHREKNEVVLRARALRRNMLPEGLLWRVLRQRPSGFKFRRQHPLGHYVADFYCASARLVIEVDGQSHSMGGAPQHDARRDEWMTAEGLRLIRIAAVDVMNDLNSAVTAILIACRR
jgi:very-short-patch-repair endonuclease